MVSTDYRSLFYQKWKTKCPMLRLGQIISNAFTEDEIPLFYVKDNDFWRILYEYVDNVRMN